MGEGGREGGKEDVQLHLPAREVRIRYRHLSKGTLRAGETGSRDGVSNRHQSRRRCFNAGVILRQAA